MRIKGYPLFNKAESDGPARLVRVRVFMSPPMYRGHRPKPCTEFVLPLERNCVADNLVHDLRSTGWTVRTNIYLKGITS